MKRKISISMDDETLAVIAKAISSKKFRNRSHAVEYAIQQEYTVQREYTLQREHVTQQEHATQQECASQQKRMVKRLVQSSKRTAQDPRLLTQDLRLLEARR